MQQMEWGEQLALGLGRMDTTHREFVELYNLLAASEAEDFINRLDAFIVHTEAHFDQENRWMEQVNFPGCHRAEHDRVLTVMRDVRERAARGDAFLGRRLVEELPPWFENHVNGMDAALAFHLQTIGFDVEREAFIEGRQEGCGDAASGPCACSSAPAPSAAA
ncbi:bacteriohemerythrin [Azoarcus olearius]|uniref:Hemerythrin-like protein n=1 Tax=Azoarcus sp. (strain BH72) TaxID=418699 RepID=A1K428_AZOSB|nr:bacteriohemerythrin [Azoarcus olearius]CAL93583.1 Hemerythrin-like protein [Azoarcus olearius]